MFCGQFVGQRAAANTGPLSDRCTPDGASFPRGVNGRQAEASFAGVDALRPFDDVAAAESLAFVFSDGMTVVSCSQ